MKIIDAHCHIFPDRIAMLATQKIQKFYDIPHTAYYGKVSELVEQCEKSGVDKCVVSLVATSPTQPQKLNDFIVKCIAEFGQRLIPLGSMHPESATIEEDFKHLTDIGCMGVKIHPDMQNCKADCEGYKKIYDLCSQAGLPILIHTGDSRYDNSNPDRVENILKEFPQLTVIGAHFGGWSLWEEAADKLYKYENFIVDTCSSTYMLSDTTTKKIINKYGIDKVIFGTDFPIWQQTNEIEKIMSFGFTDDELEKIFSKNITNVLKIED